MKIGRRTMMAGAGAAAAFASPSESMAAKAVESWAYALAPDGSAIKAFSVTADAAGNSKIEEIETAPDKSPYPLFKQFFTRKASKVAIYRAPPGHYLIDQKQAKALMLLVDGEIEIKTDSGSKTAGRGGFIVFDGKAANSQRAGRAGYTAIKVLLAD